MARIVVIGAGMAGHSTALELKRRLGEDHEVIVISSGRAWTNPDTLAHIAANLQNAEHEIVPLGPLYKRKGIIFHQGMARSIYPYGYQEDKRPQVEMVFEGSYLHGEVARVPYDYLVIATGHDIDKIAGVSAAASTVPTCVIDRLDSAMAGAAELRRLVSELHDSPLHTEPKRIAVARSVKGMGGYYGVLEYLLAVDALLRVEKLRNRVELHFFDAGRPWMADILHRYESVAGQAVEAEISQAVQEQLERRHIAMHPGMRLSSLVGSQLRYVPVVENSRGTPGEIHCDLVVTEASRVLTPLKVTGSNGEDLATELYDTWGRLRVDATTVHNQTTGEEHGVWPKQFRNPQLKNIYGIGSAIALEADADRHEDKASPHTPIQTREMSHLMSRRVSEHILTQITGQMPKTLPENMEELESAMNLAWDYSLFSNCGFYAEALTPSLQRRRKSDTATGIPFAEKKTAKSSSSNLVIQRGIRAYWTVKLERYLERYRAQGRPLWWLLPS